MFQRGAQNRNRREAHLAVHDAGARRRHNLPDPGIALRFLFLDGLQLGDIPLPFAHRRRELVVAHVGQPRFERRRDVVREQAAAREVQSVHLSLLPLRKPLGEFAELRRADCALADRTRGELRRAVERVGGEEAGLRLVVHALFYGVLRDPSLV